MRRPWLRALLIFAVAGGLIGWREWRRPRSAAPASPPSVTSPRVVLYADLSEVDEPEGCGAMIRGVREAARRDVAIEEIDARTSSSPPARYRLLVAPTVLILDASGREAKRYEGESRETVSALRAELEKLAASR